MEENDELSWIKQRLNFTVRSDEFNVDDGIWNALVTSHVLIKDVAELLTEEQILQAIMFFDERLKDAEFDRPWISVAALYSHAGADDAIGREFLLRQSKKTKQKNQCCSIVS
jgi:4-hydroxy-L-threonine phosphate dehydrogenase PdxA